MNIKSYYWDMVSEEIGKIMLREFYKNMRILEIGFSGGHFLEFLYENGYKDLSGVEIRKNEYEKTLKQFMKKNIHIELINDDVLKINNVYDAIFSTGLIQCLDESSRKEFLNHVSKMANFAIFTVPNIVNDRNLLSIKQVAVSGCREYATSNIVYELSKYYLKIRMGVIKKEKTNLNEDFIYYICNK